MQNHARFQKRAGSKETIQSEKTMEAWMVSRGIPTVRTEKTIAPTYAERHKHIDKGDLIHTINGRPRRGEVKWCKYSFNSRDTFPFSRFIVCAAHVWDLAVPKPLYLAKTSCDFRYAAVVRGYTDSNWVAEEGHDPYYDGVIEQWYYVDTDLVHFVDLQDPKITFLDFLYAPPQHVQRYDSRIRASQHAASVLTAEERAGLRRCLPQLEDKATAGRPGSTQPG